ncbi:MAG: hypothetical protein KKC21_00250 [Nitrospinae bacterium]|nr:hypothetical protein [Nitrospinota bacterium]
MKKAVAVVGTGVIAVVLVACATVRTVRQQDLDAWVGVPVEALDAHSLFLTIPMVRTKTESGIKIRNYANGRNFGGCSGLGFANVAGSWVNANSFSTCSSGWVGCNNIFYIKDGKVIEYAPTGRCFTDERVQPQARYQRLMKQ